MKGSLPVREKIEQEGHMTSINSKELLGAIAE